MYAGQKKYFSALLFCVMILGFFSACKKDKVEAPVQETGTVTDIEGHVYKTVRIGNQWWMAENLMTRRYRNGSYLFMVTANYTYSEWDTTTKGAMCIYNNQAAATTGYLYNWYAISDTNNIAPAGWHIPTDDEWNQLENYLGMIGAESKATGWRGVHEGEKLKQQGQDMWRPYEQVWATNESGFSALAGGCRMFNGTDALNEWSYPLDQQSTGFWWSSSNYGDNEAWYRHLDYKNANVFRAHGHKNYGFSIRCVKD